MTEKNYTINMPKVTIVQFFKNMKGYFTVKRFA